MSEVIQTVPISVCIDCRSVIECDEGFGVPEEGMADFRNRFEDGMEREIGNKDATIVIHGENNGEPYFGKDPCVICRTPLAGDRFEAQISYTNGTNQSQYFPYTPEYRVWRVAQEKGKAAASLVFDGNTTKSEYQTVLQGICDGDPAIMEAYNPPNLSGEYADDLDEEELMEIAGWVPHDGTSFRDYLAMQFNDDASDAFWAELERVCIYHLKNRIIK